MSCYVCSALCCVSAYRDVLLCFALFFVFSVLLCPLLYRDIVVHCCSFSKFVLASGLLAHRCKLGIWQELVRLKDFAIFRRIWQDLAEPTAKPEFRKIL